MSASFAASATRRFTSNIGNVAVGTKNAARSNRAGMKRDGVSHSSRPNRANTKKGQPLSPEMGMAFELSRLPHNATASDVHKAISPVLKTCSPSLVQLLHYRHTPRGRALVQFSDESMAQEAMRKLDKQEIFGRPVRTSSLTDELEHEKRQPGSGPIGAHYEKPRRVLLWGTPGKLKPAQLLYAIKDFDVVRNEQGLAEVYTVPLPEKAFSFFSKFILTMADANEAHRLVRSMHMTHWDEAKQFRIYAKVVD